MAIETLISNGDDRIRVGIAELEFHANMGGSYPESRRPGDAGPLSCYVGGLSLGGELPPLDGSWRDL